MKTSRRTSAGEDVVDEPPHAARELVRADDPAIARSERGGAELLREGAVSQHSDERIRKSLRVIDVDDQSGLAVVHELYRAADDGPTRARERLDDDAAEAFGPRRQHEHGRLVDRAEHLVGGL